METLHQNENINTKTNTSDIAVIYNSTFVCAAPCNN